MNYALGIIKLLQRLGVPEEHIPAIGTFRLETLYNALVFVINQRYSDDDKDRHCDLAEAKRDYETMKGGYDAGARIVRIKLERESLSCKLPR